MFIRVHCYFMVIIIMYFCHFLSLNSAVSFPKRVPQTSGWHSCGTLPRFRPWPIESGSLGWKDLRSEALSKGLSSLVLQVNLMSLWLEICEILQLGHVFIGLLMSFDLYVFLLNISFEKAVWSWNDATTPLRNTKYYEILPSLGPEFIDPIRNRAFLGSI